MSEAINGVRAGGLGACALAVVLAGCASASHEVVPLYVSPMTYRSYDCGQVAAELQRVQNRVQQLGARLDQAASNDKKLAGVGMLIFWPALFALGGTKEQEAEYARLRGEYEGLQQAAIEKKCNASPTPAAPSAPAPSASAASSAASA